MIQEGIYTLSELRKAIQESEAKPKIGDGVEKANKKNNKDAVEDIVDRTGKYNGKKMEHTVILPDDRNKTTIDLQFNELEPPKEWFDRVEAQAEGYPSVENKKNSDVKDNGGLEYEGNKEFYKHREKLEKNWKQTKKDDMDAGLKGRELKKYNIVNESEEFDAEDDYMTTPDTVAKDFIRWATTEADRGHNYPINAMQMVYDAYANNDDEALEDVATAYFEAKYNDMAQWETVMKGVEKAVNAFGYYNIDRNEEEEASDEDKSVISDEAEETETLDVNNDNVEADEPESLDENKNNKSKKNMKRLHYKKTTFLNENQMFNMIPEEYKTDGNRFYVKDASGTEYLLECTVDKTFDYATLHVVSKLNEGKVNSEMDRMKQLFGYESANYFTKVDKLGESMNMLHEQIDKMKTLENSDK